MIDSKIATLLINIITLTIVYLFTVSISGYARAWFAQKMGDDTPADHGFLTLNPFVHTDLIGAFLFLGFGIGWGRYFPIDPFNITKPHRTLKVIVAYLSDSFVRLFVALISLMLLIVLFGTGILVVANPMILEAHLSHEIIAVFYPNSSPLEIAIAFILIALAYINVLLGVLYLIINAFDLALVLIALRANDPHEEEQRLLDLYGRPMRFFGSLFLILFFSYPLKRFVVSVLFILGYSIISLFKAALGLL